MHAYRGVTIAPAAAPNLAWQSDLTQTLRGVEPLLSAATADDFVERLGEIAPVVLTGSGPTHEDRTFAGLRFRARKNPSEPEA